MIATLIYRNARGNEVRLTGNINDLKQSQKRFGGEIAMKSSSFKEYAKAVQISNNRF
jgi:hypothetical protein